MRKKYHRPTETSPSKENEPAIVEDAVKYIIFLADANQLFDIALGMYDFSLVLMIAQYAQKASLPIPFGNLWSLNIGSRIPENIFRSFEN
jgi:hypothetical protein